MLTRRAVLRALGSGAGGLLLATGCDRLPGRLGASPVPVIGYVFNGGPEDVGPTQLEGLRDGLREHGLVEGQNLRIEWRWAMGRNERLPQLFDELLKLDVRLLITPGGTAVRAARQATDKVPIILIGGGNPVDIGLANSLARPGGNVTGITQRSTDDIFKSIELLTEIFPTAHRLAHMNNLSITPPSAIPVAIRRAAELFHLELLMVDVSTPERLEPAFEQAAAWGAEVLSPNNVVPLNFPREALPKLALRYRLPGVCLSKEWVQKGFLFGRSASQYALGHKGAWYVARILGGADPAELPIELNSEFEITVNRATLAYFGLTLPPQVQAQVTEWID